MASEATLMAVPGNMHIDVRVIEVACIKSEVKFVLKGLRGCFGLNGLKRPPKLLFEATNNRHHNDRSCKTLHDYKFLIPPSRRRSKGPLPSCFCHR